MRSITRVVTTPPASPGFIGDGHTAVEVVAPDALDTSDPFVLLMDDRLDIPHRRQIGGPHPHAGLETVTFVVEGTLRDRDEGDLRSGDVLWMTAGRGIIHNEAVEAEGRSRVLQLWIALPARDRDLAPQFELVRRDAAPVVRSPGVEGRVYSGSSNGVQSSTSNRVPVTMVDIELQPGARFHHDLAPSHNGFFYVLDGEVRVGDVRLERGQVGWLQPGDAGLELVAGSTPARVVLYSGEPIDEPLVQRGPFVAGSMNEVAAYYQSFRAAEFAPMSAVARRQRAGAPSV